MRTEITVHKTQPVNIYQCAAQLRHPLECRGLDVGGKITFKRYNVALHVDAVVCHSQALHNIWVNWFDGAKKDMFQMNAKKDKCT